MFAPATSTRSSTWPGYSMDAAGHPLATSAPTHTSTTASLSPNVDLAVFTHQQRHPYDHQQQHHPAHRHPHPLSTPALSSSLVPSSPGLPHTPTPTLTPFVLHHRRSYSETSLASMPPYPSTPQTAYGISGGMIVSEPAHAYMQSSPAPAPGPAAMGNGDPQCGPLLPSFTDVFMSHTHPIPSKGRPALRPTLSHNAVYTSPTQSAPATWPRRMIAAPAAPAPSGLERTRPISDAARAGAGAGSLAASFASGFSVAESIAESEAKGGMAETGAGGKGEGQGRSGSGDDANAADPSSGPQHEAPAPYILGTAASLATAHHPHPHPHPYQPHSSHPHSHHLPHPHAHPGNYSAFAYTDADLSLHTNANVNAYAALPAPAPGPGSYDGTFPHSHSHSHSPPAPSSWPPMDHLTTHFPPQYLTHANHYAMPSHNLKQDEPILAPGELPAPRPPSSYAALIGEALLLAPPPHQLYVSEISDSIKRRYAYYRQNPTKVYNGVRHQTSMCKAFVKLPRPFGDQSGGARKWGIRAGCETWFSPSGFNPPPQAKIKSATGLVTGKAKATAQSKRLAIGTTSPDGHSLGQGGAHLKRSGTGSSRSEPFSPSTMSGGPSIGPAYDGTSRPAYVQAMSPPTAAHLLSPNGNGDGDAQAHTHAHAQSQLQGQGHPFLPPGYRYVPMTAGHSHHHPHQHQHQHQPLYVPVWGPYGAAAPPPPEQHAYPTPITAPAASPGPGPAPGGWRYEAPRPPMGGSIDGSTLSFDEQRGTPESGSDRKGGLEASPERV